MSSLVSLFAYLPEYACLERLTFTNLYHYVVNLMKPVNAIALFIKQQYPFLFPVLALGAVSVFTYEAFNETRLKFKIPGLLEGKVQPDMPSLSIYHTQIHIKSTVVPTLLTILVLILINFLLVTLPPDAWLLIAITSEVILASTQFSSVGMLKDSKNHVRRRRN